MKLIICSGIILLILFMGGYLINTYNGLIIKRNRVYNAWAQIDVQLQRRFDLIPNMMETVKGASSHEQETLKKVVDARNLYLRAEGIAEKMNAESVASKAFGNFFALHESYPDLKANAAYLELMDTLKEIEECIARSRHFYNDTVNIFNNKVMTFPTNVIGGTFNIKEEPLFKAENEVKRNVEVKF